MTQRLDWFRVLADLQATGGMSRSAVAHALGLPERTVRAWYSGENEPNFHDGDAIVGLWCSVTGKARDKAPRCRDRTLSAARAR